MDHTEDVANDRSAGRTEALHTEASDLEQDIRQKEEDLGGGGSKVPFFEKLNKDCRLVVYDHFYGTLPPLALDKDSDCRGMILSCKLAYAELSDAAQKHLIIFAREFSEDFAHKYGTESGMPLSFPVPLNVGFSYLRVLTLTVPIETLVSLGFDQGDPATLEWECWRSILSHPFHKVAILVKDTASSSFNIRAFKWSLQCTMDTIEWYAENVWLNYKDAKATVSLCDQDRERRQRGELSSKPPEARYIRRLVYQLAITDPMSKTWEEIESKYSEVMRKDLAMSPVRTKEISVTWDLREERALQPAVF